LIEVILSIIIFLAVFAFAESIPDYNDPYAPIFFNKEKYTWTDKVEITIVAPSWNTERNGIDSIGTQDRHFIKISTGEHSLKPYKLTETEPNSGIFTGEVTLTGFLHDVDNDGISDTNPRTTGTGPTNGFLESERDGGITVSFEFADGVVLTSSSLIDWNIGHLSFKKSSYLIDEFAEIQLFDPDMNLNPEAINQIKIDVSSNSDIAGIQVNAIETNENSGLFKASISFSQNSDSSGNRLFAIPGDSIYVKYRDNTLPSPYSTSDNLDVRAESKIESNIPLMDRIMNSEIFIQSGTKTLSSKSQINEQLQIIGTIQNNQEYAQPFVYLIQVMDEKKKIISLSWIQGELSPQQNIELSTSWIPDKSGNYTIESFVWKSLKNPIPLSTSMTKSLLIQ